MDIGQPHLGKEMCTSPQVEAKIHKRGREPTRPVIEPVLQPRIHFDAGLLRGDRIIEPLDPQIEGIRQRCDQSRKADRQDRELLPGCKSEHVRRPAMKPAEVSISCSGVRSERNRPLSRPGQPC